MTASVRKKTILIEQFARKLGFDGFGITGPHTAEAVEWYEQWLNRDYEGEMSYMRSGYAKPVEPQITGKLFDKNRFFTN